MPTVPTAHDRKLESVISQINKVARAMKDSKWDREQLAKLRRQYNRLCEKRDKLMESEK